MTTEKGRFAGFSKALLLFQRNKYLITSTAAAMAVLGAFWGPLPLALGGAVFAGTALAGVCAVREKGPRLKMGACVCAGVLMLAFGAYKTYEGNTQNALAADCARGNVAQVLAKKESKNDEEIVFDKRSPWSWDELKNGGTITGHRLSLSAGSVEIEFTQEGEEPIREAYMRSAEGSLSFNI